MVELCRKGRSDAGQFELLHMVLFLKVSQKLKIGKQFHLIKETIHGLEGVALLHVALVTDIYE